MTDAELVKQVLSGNSNAFRYLVSRHQQLVAHIVGRMVKNEADLEDISQEVFVKVYRKLNRFRGESKLSTWIAAIAYNTTVSFIRKNYRVDEINFDNLNKSETEFLTPGKIMEKREMKEYLLKLIDELPVNYRSVLTLFHLDEFSYKEIEQITGMPEGTIKSYLSRARGILKEKIEALSVNEKTNIFAGYAEQ
ncbi:MAG: sigma-70 family RNA polymerase sigma factor [Prolixibacteraceae bacterium]|nr:sigma-70 family RNA polymerase sigma factor [Prolixibacteraceae bacterium]